MVAVIILLISYCNNTPISPKDAPAYYAIRAGKIAAVGCISCVIIGLVIVLVVLLLLVVAVAAQPW